MNSFRRIITPGTYRTESSSAFPAHLLPVSPGASIQAAIDAVEARGGGIVTLDVGTHTIDEPIIIPSHTSLRGYGVASELSRDGDFPAIILPEQNFSISSMSFSSSSSLSPWIIPNDNRVWKGEIYSIYGQDIGGPLLSVSPDVWVGDIYVYKNNLIYSEQGVVNPTSIIALSGSLGGIHIYQNNFILNSRDLPVKLIHIENIEGISANIYRNTFWSSCGADSVVSIYYKGAGNGLYRGALTIQSNYINIGPDEGGAPPSSGIYADAADDYGTIIRILHNHLPTMRTPIATLNSCTIENGGFTLALYNIRGDGYYPYLFDENAVASGNL